jgi:hypothetical protein
LIMMTLHYENDNGDLFRRLNTASRQLWWQNLWILGYCENVNYALADIALLYGFDNYLIYTWIVTPIYFVGRVRHLGQTLSAQTYSDLSCTEENFLDTQVGTMYSNPQLVVSTESWSVCTQIHPIRIWISLISAPTYSKPSRFWSDDASFMHGSILSVTALRIYLGKLVDL